MEDLDSFSTPINQVNDSANKLLERGLMDKGLYAKVQKETGALKERQRLLRNTCRESGDR